MSPQLSVDCGDYETKRAVKMTDKSLCGQLEEGEIVDDDFEDISDNSIIESSFGKFVSTNGHLRALSLSSHSDTIDKNLCNVRVNRKILHRKSKSKLKERRQKKRKLEVKEPPQPDTSDDEDVNILQRKNLKEKLKNAVQVSGHKNSLEIRLKAMQGLPNDLDEKNDDLELENLRMEALKTAVLNKCQRRKRKKALENEEKPQDNKENNTPKDDQAVDLDEDEDVLRASLLAGLAKKMTDKATIAKENVEKKNGNHLITTTIVIPNNAQKTNIQNVIKRSTITKTVVKPLIINVNGDSDSEEEKTNEVVSDKSLNLKEISHNVEKFLKEQRDKFESTVKKNDQKSVLEKSAVKLLPKSQQIEYQQLLRKIRNAERRKRIRKVSINKTKETLKKNDNVSANTEIVNSVTKSEINNSSKGLKNLEEKKKSPIASEFATLQKTLRQIKIQRSRSLQMKSKYHVLTPIIRQITLSSNERKTEEQRIKILLKQLNDARNNLSRSHQRFSSLVRQLVCKKEQIDKSLEEEIRKRKMEHLENIRKIEMANRLVLVSSTPKEVVLPTSTIVSTTNTEIQDMDVCDSDDTDIGQIDIVDPNDIDQIFKKKTIAKTIPDYVSPLDFNYKYDDRYKSMDPLAIICPYEVNGSCRDKDCKFKHYLKNI